MLICAILNIYIPNKNNFVLTVTDTYSQILNHSKFASIIVRFHIKCKLHGTYKYSRSYLLLVCLSYGFAVWTFEAESTRQILIFSKLNSLWLLPSIGCTPFFVVIWLCHLKIIKISGCAVFYNLSISIIE